VTILRQGLGLAGVLLAVLAVMQDDRRIGWGAVALLTGSMILRLVSRRRAPPNRDQSV
jgi:hypothetical protein